MTSIDYSQRPSKIQVNLSALESNYFLIKDLVAPAKVMAILKANAYGHGISECATRLQRAGVEYVGVALLEEGEQLRSAGIQIPIHVFGGILGSQIERFLRADLELTASSVAKLETISQVARQLGLTAKVHLKIDSGMGRVGVRPSSAKALIEKSAELAGLKVKGIFSHFASSDERDLSFARQQLHAFLPVAEYAKTILGKDLLAHMSNSGAIYQLPEARLDMVRPGLCLYGVTPASFLEGKLYVKPVMSITSHVVFFKVARAGETISYGQTWQAPTDSRIVTVPIGYGDGYMRALSNKASVIIRGKKFPIVGRICMDQLMANIGSDEAYNGDLVTVLGQDGGSKVNVTELAELAGTVPHEILSNFNLRMHREFIG